MGLKKIHFKDIYASVQLGALFSRVQQDSAPSFVGPSVHPSVRPSVCPSVSPLVRRSGALYFFGVYGVFGYTALAQMLH